MRIEFLRFFLIKDWIWKGKIKFFVSFTQKKWNKIFILFNGLGWEDKSNGCNGTFGGINHHKCVQKPGYKTPRSYCILPESSNGHEQENEKSSRKSYLHKMSLKK